MSKPTLDGITISQSNAKTLVVARHPRAVCKGSTDNAGRRDHFVYMNGGKAGEMYLAYGKTKPAAWKAAAIRLSENSTSA